MKTINQGHYIGGGVASIFIGFGIGQAIQGRWKERGWIHTTVQSGALLVYIGSLAFTVSSVVEDMSTRDASVGDISGSALIGSGLTLGLVLVILGSRIWEMVDTWMLPDSIKIISSSQKIGASSLYSYKTKLNVPSIALQWQF